MKGPSRAEFLDTLVHERGGAAMMEHLWDSMSRWQEGTSSPSCEGCNGHVFRHGDFLVATMMMPQPSCPGDAVYIGAVIGRLPVEPWNVEVINSAPMRYFLGCLMDESQLGIAEIKDGGAEPMEVQPPLNANGFIDGMISIAIL
ncbi:MAG: hypothetical protein ACI8T1_004875 [Verrucomicrobiales bacterium]